MHIIASFLDKQVSYHLQNTKDIPAAKDDLYAYSFSSFGYVIKVVGRVPVFILGATINLVVIIVMFSWQPTLDSQIGESITSVVIVMLSLQPTLDSKLGESNRLSILSLSSLCSAGSQTLDSQIGESITSVVIVMFSWQPTLDSQIGEIIMYVFIVMFS
jgi:hypothetical protein